MSRVDHELCGWSDEWPFNLWDGYFSGADPGEESSDGLVIDGVFLRSVFLMRVIVDAGSGMVNLRRNLSGWGSLAAVVFG